jgi:hypothetical protein
MSIQSIEVLSNAVNAAVVRMPGRKRPGLVVQSDKLVYLTSLGRSVAELAANTGNQELARLAGNLGYELDELMVSYREGCEKKSN